MLSPTKIGVKLDEKKKYLDKVDTLTNGRRIVTQAFKGKLFPVKKFMIGVMNQILKVMNKNPAVVFMT